MFLNDTKMDDKMLIDSDKCLLWWNVSASTSI